MVSAATKPTNYYGNLNSKRLSWKEKREEMLKQKISISIITYLSAGLGGAEEVVLRGVPVVLVA